MTLELAYTCRGLSPAIKDDLRDALVPYFGEVAESEIILASETPPTWVRLIADLITWKTVLAVPVAAYFKRLAEHTADAHWALTEGVRRALEDKACKALRDVAAALREAQQAGGEGFSITLQFDVPKGFFGTSLTLRPESVEDAASYVASFVARADAVHEFVETHIQQDILGPVQLTLLPDGTFEIAWQTRDFKIRKGVIR